MAPAFDDARSVVVRRPRLLFGIWCFASTLFCWSWMRQPVSLLKSWQVSSLGRVKNRRGQVSAGTMRPDAYFQVGIRIQRKQHFFLVHRLVCRTFFGIPPNPDYTHINHKNGNKSDNRVCNLEYATPSQNAVHSVALDKYNGAPLRGCKLVKGQRLGSKEWTKYDSMFEASIKTGSSMKQIRRSCQSGHSTTEGYQFEFAAPAGHSSFAGEVWRDALDPNTGRSIAGWQVSSLGRYNTSCGSLSWGHLHPSGYRQTYFRVGGVSKSVHVHRLVVRAFLGQPPSPDHAYVYHRDFNKSNNAVENLEYATARGNKQHFFASGHGLKYASKSGRSRSKPVRARRRGASQWSTFPSMSTVAKRLGVYPGGVSACCSGKQVQHKGYEFEYAPADVPDVLPGEEWRDIEFD